VEVSKERKSETDIMRWTSSSSSITFRDGGNIPLSLFSGIRPLFPSPVSLLDWTGGEAYQENDPSYPFDPNTLSYHTLSCSSITCFLSCIACESESENESENE